MSKNAIIIPFRGLKKDKSRLRRDFSNETVERLLYSMVKRTLKVVMKLDYEKEIFLLTKNKNVKFDADYNLLLDEGEDLNEALEKALRKIKADNYVILMADLPLINKENIEYILSYISEKKEVVLVKSQDNGTSVIAFPNKFSFISPLVFGANSSKRFIEIFEKNKIPFKLIEKAAWGMDLDTRKDLKEIIKNNNVPLFLQLIKNDDLNE